MFIIIFIWVGVGWFLSRLCLVLPDLLAQANCPLFVRPLFPAWDFQMGSDGPCTFLAGGVFPVGHLLPPAPGHLCLLPCPLHSHSMLHFEWLPAFAVSSLSLKPGFLLLLFFAISNWVLVQLHHFPFVVFLFCFVFFSLRGHCGVGVGWWGWGGWV